MDDVQILDPHCLFHLFPGSALTVRRGSEPALNNIGQDEPIPDYSNTGTFPRKAKRWSAIVTPSSGVQFTSTPKRVSQPVNLLIHYLEFHVFVTC